MYYHGEGIGDVWPELLRDLSDKGIVVAPRGLECKEFLGVTVHLDDARRCVLLSDIRNLNYRFMVAEWLWIWYGRDDVETIAQYNRNIAAFSDNGVDFNGAYGKHVKPKWHRVRELLYTDSYTRQAVLDIYTLQYRSTRDVPCTISVQFLWRESKLHTIVNMRSSDIWLGLPYDIFNFAMIGQCMAADLREQTSHVCEPGSLTFNLGSSHLYANNFEAASLYVDASDLRMPVLPTTPGPKLEAHLIRPTAFERMGQPWDALACVLLDPRRHALDNLKAVAQ